MAHDLRPDRVEDNVACEFEKMALLLHQYRLEATLEEMADSFEFVIEPLSVNTVQKLHASGEIGTWGFDE